MTSSNSKQTKNNDIPQQQAELKPNPLWFKPVMFGFMVIGLLWIVVYYITSASSLTLPIPTIGQWNLAIGFGLILIGFGMTTRWR